ncbi:hypothetical protein F4818DRAFT_440141 [Hypoxylon cercidicola]|nr:hypothetical protein F4818DRAFT_440141 [Hypoxylon cercidicola]
MSRFDPTKPIDDPTVWYPAPGLWVKTDSTRGNRKVGNSKDGGGNDNDDDDSGDAFALDSADYAALNRYVWTAKLLPTNRDDYKNIIGISTDDELTDDIWNAADNVIVTYSTMQGEASNFLSVTWEQLVTIANKIFSYAQDAGGDVDLEDPNKETSYYRAMLTWVRDWNDENNSDHPDQDKLQTLQKNIQEATNDEIKNADALKKRTDDAWEALTEFHDACKEHQTDLAGKSKTMMNLLEGENGIIAQLTEEIAGYMDEIKDLQEKIEKGKCPIHATALCCSSNRKKIQETAYYIWIPFIGTIAGVTIDILAEEDIKRLRDQIKGIQERVNQDQMKLQDAMRMSADITSMGTHIDNLVDCIRPAITTLEKIQGAWRAMSADLQGLHDMFEGQLDHIPGFKLEQLQLNQIVAQWNTLKNDVDIFRKNAYLTTEPPKDTMQECFGMFDRGGFWVAKCSYYYFLVPFNRIAPFILNRLMHIKIMFRALRHSGLSDSYIVQDVGVPFDKVEEFTA